MTILPFLLIGSLAGGTSLALRGRRAWSTATAVAGLAGMIVTATLLNPASGVPIASTTLVASEWLRLYALLGSVVAILLVAIDEAGHRERDVPSISVIGLTTSVAALAVPEPGVAILAATAGGLAGVLVAAPVGAAARATFVGVRELRALAVAGALAIVAVAWLAHAPAAVLTLPAAVGAAVAAFGIAVAVRFGAIPFHLWAARVADAAPGATLPLLLAWSPAAMAAIALAWIDGTVAPLGLPLTGERTLLAGIGLVTLILGLIAAWIQDDLEHIVGYTIAADAGFVILALSSLDRAAWEPARIWLLVVVVGRSALAAWAVAIHGAFGTRRVPELAGWARRAPLLAVALGAIAVVSVGWPALAAWQARATLAQLALPTPLAILATAAPIGSAAILGRLLWIGSRPAGQVVTDGRSERPAWPGPIPSRPMVGRGAAERAVERVAHALGGGLDVVWALPAAARLNRAPLSSIAVGLLAVLSLAVASGGFGVAEAARARPLIAGNGPLPSDTPAPSASPSNEPGPGSTPGLTFRPVIGTPSPGIGGSSAPTGLDLPSAGR